MDTAHIPTHIPTTAPAHLETAVGDDPMERALQELTRAGFLFEVLSHEGDMERAA